MGMFKLLHLWFAARPDYSQQVPSSVAITGVHLDPRCYDSPPALSRSF